MTPREILRLEYGDSRNFMTPHILGRGTIFKDNNKIVVYELAKGRGIPRYGGYSPVIYGVSVVKYDRDTGTTERLTDKTYCTEFRFAVDSYIKSLKKEFKYKE